MVRYLLPVAAATAFIFCSTSAFALESNVTVKSTQSADAVWQKIGDFCGIKAWIPAVAGCVLSPDGKQRTVSLKGGGDIVERLDHWDAAKHSYSYSILSGPLPVADYHSTLSVSPDGQGSTLNWHGTYQAKGASDAEAKKTIDGIYQDSAKSLLGS